MNSFNIFNPTDWPQELAFVEIFCKHPPLHQYLGDLRPSNLLREHKEAM